MKKRIVALLLVAALIAALTGCSRYSTHYNAVAFVHSNDAHNAYMSYYKFEGTMVFQLKGEKNAPVALRYSGATQTGAAAVYYDYSGTKTELFTLGAGESAASTSETFTPNGTIYVIVETSEPCENGRFDFEIMTK